MDVSQFQLIKLRYSDVKGLKTWAASVSINSICPFKRCMYTTQSPSLAGLGIGITYPASPSHRKWYDPRAGLPHPKSTFEAGNVLPDDTTNAGPSLLPLQYIFSKAGSGRWASTQSMSPKKCSFVTAPSRYSWTASATQLKGFSYTNLGPSKWNIRCFWAWITQLLTCRGSHPTKKKIEVYCMCFIWETKYVAYEITHTTT